MRIAIVGPTHPIKGGIAQHTTVLAHQLAQAGHQVEITSWLRQYPRRLYPGVQTVEVPELAPFSPTRRTLCWDRPDSWVRAARRMRAADLVVFAHVTSPQAVPYALMVRALRGRARTVVICHNVLPHEPGRFDARLTGALLGSAGRVVTHSAEQAVVARLFTSAPIGVAHLAPFMPAAFTPRAPAPGEHRRLLFFGLVRPYKGVDVLVRALASVPAVSLRIAGEVWGGPEELLAVARSAGVADRVELRSGYVRADEVPALFADVDALVLPYRTATGSQAVWTGFEFGVPVIATRAGHLADDVTAGVDGLVAEADDVASLAACLREFYQPGVPERMRGDVHPVDPQPYWDRYLQVLLAPDPQTPDLTPTPTDEESIVQEAAPPGGAVLHAAKRAAEEVLWTRVALQLRLRGVVTGALPDLPATDVLSTVAQYQDSVATCRALGLPLHRDRPKNWDALGAVATVIQTLGTDVRVLDAGAARYSPILPWLRLLGVRDLVGNNLEYTKTTRHGSVVFEPGDITAMPYPDGSLDAITCMSVIEHGVPLAGFLADAARTLRGGGVLVVSTDYDQDPPDTTGKSAYGVPVKIFGPADIRGFVDMAAQHGLDLVGELRLAHEQRPVHWKRTGLDYTFIRLTFTRRVG